MRELIKPYLEMDSVIDICIVGSAPRPYRDELSDYNVEVIVDDAVYERSRWPSAKYSHSW